MRSLKRNSDPLAGEIFNKPISYQRYEDAPERLHSLYFPDETPKQATCSYEVLGPSKYTVKIKPDVARVPQSYVHEFQDMLVYRGLLASPRGTYFFDSVPTWPRGRFPSVINGGPPGDHYNYSLGRGHFALPQPSGQRALIEEPVVWSYVQHNIFGHTLLEIIPQLWARPHLADAKMLLHYQCKQLPPYIFDLTAPFGLTKESFVLAPELARCRKLFVVSRPVRLNGYFSQKAADIFTQISNYYAKKRRPGLPEKIYLSRRNINFKERRLENEILCEELFVRHGFTSLALENLSMPEQIRIMAQARRIAGPVGSAMHNIVFAQNPKNVSLFAMAPNNFKPLKNYALIENFYGRKLSVVWGEPQDQSYLSTWKMDLRHLETALKEWLKND